jgi:hypothetical protein
LEGFRQILLRAGSQSGEAAALDGCVILASFVPMSTIGHRPPSKFPLASTKLAQSTQERTTMSATLKQAADESEIRPFHVNIPEAELTELRSRIVATKWPERETVTDASQGVQLATMQALARYWATEYDWRKCEARLNALPQFITKIDGLDIHFIHARSKHENALPLIVTHGWPGSVIEQLKII